jgi:hypothetical protein
MRWITSGASTMRSLMSYSQIARDHVDSIARAINVSNARPTIKGRYRQPHLHLGALGAAHPVSVHIDETPPSVILAAGMTATVEIDDRTRGRIGALHFSELGSSFTH